LASGRDHFTNTFPGDQVVSPIRGALRGNDLLWNVQPAVPRLLLRFRMMSMIEYLQSFPIRGFCQSLWGVHCENWKTVIGVLIEQGLFERRVIFLVPVTGQKL